MKKENDLFETIAEATKPEAIYKERPSQAGQIMAVSRGATITEKQKKTLLTLLNKIELTEAQAIERDRLIAKRDAPPQLSKTGKTRVYKQFLLDKFGFFRDVWSKQMDKGNEQENESIKLLQKVTGIFGLKKNEEKYENDFFKGTPDIVTPDLVIDIKTSWDAETFPMFTDELPDKDYLYQVMAYLYLTGRRVGYVAYCLTNAGEDMILDEMRREQWRQKIIEPTAEQDQQIEDKVRAAMQFDNVPDALRVKMFKIEYDEKLVGDMIDRVKLCRTQYAEYEKEAAKRTATNTAI